MRPTPITDAFLRAREHIRGDDLIPTINHARRMERDRAELIEALRECLQSNMVKPSMLANNGQAWDWVDKSHALLTRMDADNG